MKNYFLSIVIVFSFTGCLSINPTFPKMENSEPTKLSWEDMECKSVKNGQPIGEWKKRHALTSYEWEDVQTKLINDAYKANLCADIVNKYMEDYK